MNLPTGAGTRSGHTSPPPDSGARYQPAVANRDRPRTGTIDSLTRRRWVSLVPRVVLLLALIGTLTAVVIGVVVIAVGLVLAATAG